jgi:phosphoserine phosphatase
MKIAFCFDLDGTLTREELLPKIAHHVQLWEEIDLLTNLTMRGMIGFDKSFKLRVKLLSTIPISEVKKTVSKVKIYDKLQDFIRRNNKNCFIVTGNLDVWVNDFIDKEFSCGYFSSIALHKENQLVGISKIIEKKDAIDHLREKFDLIVTIGDGMNDCSMFEKADIGIAFGGVHKPVDSLVKLSKYVCCGEEGLVKLLNSLLSYYSNEN